MLLLEGLLLLKSDSNLSSIASSTSYEVLLEDIKEFQAQKKMAKEENCLRSKKSFEVQQKRQEILTVGQRTRGKLLN